MMKSRVDENSYPSFPAKSKILRNIGKLPKTPGVYVFYGENKEILYVGKATSLRDRVRSYFSGLIDANQRINANLRIANRPVETAIGQIKDIKTIQTETVLEAFILEQGLIKKLQPKYNAMGKDDKSFCYILLINEQYPRYVIVRERELEKIQNQKFKFYQSSAFPLLANARNSSKPSFSSLKTKNYQLKNSKKFGPYTSRKNIEIVLKLLKRIFPYHSSAQKTEKGCLDFELGRCPGPYAGAITRADYLKNIRGIRMILEGKKKGLVKKLEKEMKDYSKAHEYEKAAEARNKLFALKHINDVALIAKSDENFDMISSTPQSSAFSFSDKSENSAKPSFSRAGKFRIEAYDISNISGQFAVGSMVVFNNNEPDKAEYRKFKIRTIKGSDDVGMMREVLIRRFNNTWPKPDLILLDGGMGHLQMAEEILKILKLGIPIVAVAKGKDRKNIDLKFRNKDMDSHVSNLLRNKLLIKQIMDEAHRFAIAYHRKIRKKNFIQNS